jgi:hypothetical protein
MNLQKLSLPLRWHRGWTAAFNYLRHGPGYFFLYIFGRFLLVRWAMLLIYRIKPSKAAASGPSLIEDVDVDHVVRAVSEEGLFAGLRLRTDILEELREFSSETICFGNREPNCPFRYADKAAAEQQYAQTFLTAKCDHALEACSALQALASDTRLLAIASKYLRARPVLIGAGIWWSFAAAADASQQMQVGQGFHYDIDGYRTLAFFFYLTDVTPSNGAHVYIRRSHVHKKMKHVISIHKGHSDAEIERCYGPERQVVLCGPAGFGFAEDIFGFHRGLHPESGERLMLQVRYGPRDYGAGWAD